MGLTEFKPSVVRRIPDQLDYGILYVCFECNVVVHLCACGCGEKVVLPLSPSCWSIEYDGEFVSMRPSVGNFQMSCRSHYWIKQNRVLWVKGAGTFTSTQDTNAEIQAKHHRQWFGWLKKLFMS
jgi:hypothetical protein